MTDWWRAATGQTLEQIEQQLDLVDTAREQFESRFQNIIERESGLTWSQISISALVRMALGNDLQIVPKQSE